MKKVVSILVVVCAVAGVGAYLFRKEAKPSVVFVMIDTLRADHLGVYGYPRNTSPRIDAFARENILYNYAVTVAPWTPPSVATMFTGVYPVSHGVVPPNDREKAQKAGTQLPSELWTLAEIFKAHGYQTGGASPNPWITEEFGFHQGFDSFWFQARAVAEKINSVGKKMLDSFITKDEPFFLYLHYLDPHDPYKPPAEFKELMAKEPAITGYPEDVKEKLDLYDAEIRYTDQKVGEIFDYLKEKGLYDDVAIVLVADHGEQFMERGHQGHGFQLFDEEVRVPFIIKPPRATSPKSVDVTVSTIDILPTVLEMTNIPPHRELPGVSMLRDEVLAAREGVYSEISRKINDQRAFTTPDGLKLIVEIDPEKGEQVLGVFNSKRDPRELSPLQDKELVATLVGELQTTRQYALEGRVLQSDTARGQLKDSTIEQLKTLGYLQ
jgi:arylsulfatase A-like enzyme